MKAILLINPTSGKEKVDEVVNICKRKFEEKGYHLDIYFSTSADDLISKSELWATDYDTYLVCGGDGTVNEVVNGVMKSEIRPNIAVIPLGTVNDIAKILGASKRVEKNLDFIFENKPVATDINQINDKYFVYVAGAGYLTSVSYEADREEKKKYGSLAYLMTGVKGLRKKPFFRARVECNSETFEMDVSLLLILSANQFGGLRLFRFSKHTRLNDGLVGIRIFTGRNIWLIVRLLLFILLAGTKQYKEIHMLTNQAIITPLTDEIINWNADGELATTGKIELKVIPKAINFYVHPRRVKRLY